MSETGKQANSGGRASPAASFLHNAGNLTLNRMPDGAPEGTSWDGALSVWALETVSPPQRKDLMRRLSPAALLKAYQSGKSRVLLDFTDIAGQKRRLTLQLSAKESSGEVLAAASLSPSVPVQPAAGAAKPHVHAERAPAAAAPKGAAPVASASPTASPAPPASSESRPTAEGSANSAPFQVVLRGYPLFARFDLNHPSLSAGDLLRDAEGACADTAWPCTWPSFLKTLADRFVRSAWRDEFLARFATEALRNAVQEGKEQLSQTFSSDRGTWRMDIFLPEKGSDPAICCVGLCPVENDSAGKGLAVADPEAASARAAIADMQMEMEMERTETKKRHRRFSFFFALFAVIIGLMSGTVLDQKVTAFSDFVRQLLPAESEAQPETPVERVAEEAVIPEAVTSYVIFTEPVTFTADVMENGTPRTNTASDKYEAVPFTVSVKEIMTPEDFSTKYAKAGYYLDGTEACAHLQLTFTDPGATAAVIPRMPSPFRC